MFEIQGWEVKEVNRLIETSRPLPASGRSRRLPGHQQGEVGMGHFLSLLAVILAIASAPPAANAQERTGFAVHGGFGGSVIKDRDGAATFEGNGFGFNFGAEYRFVPRFALGVDLFNLGSADDTFGGVDVNIDAAGIDFFGRLIFPVSESVEIYGRAGMALYNADVTPGATIDIFGKDGTSLGAGVDIGRGDFSWRLEGRYFNGMRDESGALLTVGLTYRF
jgi:Outer membrane protein beta-barrel domain